MRVLVVGSGGREHALAWAIAQSPLLTKLWVAPGNPGTAELAENVAIGVEDLAALVAFARDNKVDLVVPGPEAPLVAGLADACAAAGIACCGPTQAAAQLEGSKSFTKEMADAAGIPTARWERFETSAPAIDFVRRRGAPIVVKADGLAAGKGVVVAATVEEAEAAIRSCLDDKTLGSAGASVVIEECLVGEEISVFALCDGENAIFLGAAQDHKRVGNGDTGPNTGGMGAVSPPPTATPELIDAVMHRVIHPTLREMAQRGTPFRGILFAGLMLTAEGPQLIEFNVRFGDPECETLLPRLQGDLLPALYAACNGTLAACDMEWRENVASVVVVMAAKGYPGTYQRGTPIRGVEAANALPGVRVFHAGTEHRDGVLCANGGRVLAVCGTGDNLASAREAAYRGVAAIDWPEGFCRSDIGMRALVRD